jgi:hypothetical protein
VRLSEIEKSDGIDSAAAVIADREFDFVIAGRQVERLWDSQAAFQDFPKHFRLEVRRQRL